MARTILIGGSIMGVRVSCQTVSLFSTHIKSISVFAHHLAVAHRARRTPAKSEVHVKARLFARNGENGQRPLRVSLRMQTPNRELLQLHTCRSPDEPEYFGCRNRCERDKAPLLSPGFVMTTT